MGWGKVDFEFVSNWVINNEVLGFWIDYYVNVFVVSVVGNFIGGLFEGFFVCY